MKKRVYEISHIKRCESNPIYINFAFGFLTLQALKPAIKGR